MGKEKGGGKEKRKEAGKNAEEHVRGKNANKSRRNEERRGGQEAVEK